MEKMNRHNSECEVEIMETKQPLKRLQIALHRIVEVAIPLHLGLLTRHKENIEKFQSEGQWQFVHSEQVNASRTVQQLKSDIHELEIVRQQVRLEDLPKFEKRVQDIQKKAIEAIDSFIEMHSSVTHPFSLCLPNGKDEQNSAQTSSKRSPTPPMVTLPEEWVNEKQSPVSEAEEITEQTELQKPAEPLKSSLASKSWNSLKKDLLELNGMMHNFACLVMNQQHAVNSIEYNVADAQENVQEGTKHLGKAAMLKAGILPVTGAVIGGIVGGPIGLLAGFKLAAVAGLVSGGVLGFTGGKYLQKKKTNVCDVELQNLKPIQRSQSFPNLSNKNH